MGYGFRTYGGRIHWGSVIPPGIKLLVIVNAAVFLIQTLVRVFLETPGELALLLWFGLVPHAVTHGLRIWQPFTYLFLHGDLWHLLINMLVLWMFGSDIERYWGRRRFFQYYFLTGIGAGVLNVLIKALTDAGTLAQPLGPFARWSEIPTIGASGAIYGVLLAAAILFPDRRVLLFPFPVMLPMRIYVLIMGAIAFYGSLGAPGDKVSHLTHLGGMLVGYIYLRRGSFLYRLRNRYSDWQRQRLRRKLEVYARKHEGETPRRPDEWVN